MPLPDTGSGTAWPPRSHEKIYQDMQVSNAWYAGDIDALETLYATTALIQRTGLWGQMARRFFGGPTPGQQAQRPVKLHVPIPSEIARVSSQVLYGEMPKIEFADLDDDGDDYSASLTPEQRKAANSRLADLLDDSIHAAFLESGELGAALGGAFLRVTWDKTIVPDAPFVTTVAQDAAIADFRFGRLTGVTFWSDLPPLDDGTPGHYRLLERHEPGRIEWGLYTAPNSDTLGTRIPLTEHPGTAGFAAIVDADSGVDTGSDLITAVYIPNVRPTRIGRKDPVASSYGRSDYEGLQDLFDALDEVYTSWMRDIRLGKSRIFASRDVIDTGKPGQGAYFDADREVYVPLDTPPGALGTGSGPTPATQLVQAQQFAIRFAEHQATAEEILRQIFIAAGYAPQTFGMSDQRGTRTMTATQVQAQERQTNLTRGAKLLYAKPQIQKLICALMDVDEFVFGGPGRSGTLPEVQFPDAAAPSIDALAQTLQLLRAANAASTETLVQMLNPDWEPEQVDQEVARINDENQAAPALPDPTSLTGADFAPGGPDGIDGYPGDRSAAGNVGAEDPAGSDGGGGS